MDDDARSNASRYSQSSRYSQARSQGSQRSARSSARSSKSRGKSPSARTAAERAKEGEQNNKLAYYVKKQAELQRQIDINQKKTVSMDMEQRQRQYEFEMQERSLRRDLQVVEDELNRDKRVLSETNADLQASVKAIKELRRQYILCCAAAAMHFVGNEKHDIHISEIRSQQRANRRLSIAAADAEEMPAHIVNMKRYVDHLRTEIRVLEDGGSVATHDGIPAFGDENFDQLLESLAAEMQVAPGRPPLAVALPSHSPRTPLTRSPSAAAIAVSPPTSRSSRSGGTSPRPSRLERQANKPLSPSSERSPRKKRHGKSRGGGSSGASVAA